MEARKLKPETKIITKKKKTRKGKFISIVFVCQEYTAHARSTVFILKFRLLEKKQNLQKRKLKQQYRD